MNNYVLSCCSTVDLKKEHLNSLGVQYICFHYELNSKEYADDFGESLSFEDLYNAMRNGADTKTSQINATEYEEYFEKILKEGKDILHITVSSGVSGAFNSANIARDILQERYPDRKIYIVDSLGGSSGSGMLIDEMAHLRNKGMDIDALRDWVEENKLKMRYWLFSTDLTYFVKGGRIGKMAGIVGGVLKLCPLISVNKNGQMIPRYKIRTKKKVMEALVNQMESEANDGINYSGKCYMCHSGCYEDARKVANLIEERFVHLKGKVEINHIGTAIGCHAGPGTVGLFFWGKERDW